VVIRVCEASVSTVAPVREQFRIMASSSGTNSLTPAGSRSSRSAAAPGSPGRRSADAGRRAAR
jgi:hypothetical protein